MPPPNVSRHNNALETHVFKQTVQTHYNSGINCESVTMRTAIICLCFLIIGHRDGSRAANYEEFKPTPIPLNEWKGSMAEGGADDQVTAPDPPASAHYWEGALRHSVYLSLVRDKIDELIAKETVISPDTKPDFTAYREVDDRNLWENIKVAPFDRLKPQEAPSLGDITILAKGRLLEDQNGFRFAEDETSKEKCSDAKCMDGVKAFWSVKRMRQRDAETIPGKYHYELTFSVTSRSQKQHKKQYDHPVRTFTVLESNPKEEPKFRVPETTTSAPRPQRAIWFHRNIKPVPNYHSRKTYQGSSLDRLFFSLFSDDDAEDYQPRYKPAYQPQTAQQSKVGHAGPVDQYHQKKVPPYRYMPQSFKYSHRPPAAQNFVPTPISQPPVQQLNDFETKYPHQPDHKYLPTNIVKTTKPAVLPTPSFTQTNFTVETNNRPNTTESITKEPETRNKIYTKQKQPPTKHGYFSEHVRPPVFNAPPGVFVTMEKKPFKPMPPLKVPYYQTKLIRNKPPIDFRPSPQVLDAQFSDPEPLSDSFRPIMNFADRDTSEFGDLSGFLSKNRTKTKPKPSKKHENKKSHRTTTSTPEIITAEHSLSMDKISLETMQWANNILGAFSKTTPMASERLNSSYIDDLSTEAITTTTAVPTEPTTMWLTTSEEEAGPTTTEPYTTTQFIPKAKKRTRPPPKFTAPKDNPIKKIKKHKRITSTTSTTTTTVRPRPLPKRPLPDLTPQASSAATGNKELESEIQNDVFTTTSTTVDLKDTTTSITTTTPRPTPVVRSTIRTTTTTAPTTTTTVATTTEDKKKNRFRQTMLMQKGTSVKHDKWSTSNNSYIDKTKTVIPLTNKYQQQARRKASNFHGYVSSTQKTVEEERNKDDHRDRLPDSNFNLIPNTAVKPLAAKMQTIRQQNAAEHVTNVETQPHNSHEVNYHDMKEQVANTEESEDNRETIDHSEYIFSVTTEASSDHEFGDPELITVTEISVIGTPYTSGKNKTKCKKKKHVNGTLTDEASLSTYELEEKLNSTTEATAVSDIFDEIFGFTVTDSVKPYETHTEQTYEGSEHHEQYAHAQDDLETFLDSLSTAKQEQEAVYDEDDEESDDDESGDDYTNSKEEESRTLRHEDIPEYRELRERPFSFLELMIMD